MPASTTPVCFPPPMSVAGCGASEPREADIYHDPALRPGVVVAEGFGEDELREFIRASALPEDQVDEGAALEMFGRLMEIAGECGLA